MSAVVLITGASTGFGRDAAERLARRGFVRLVEMAPSERPFRTVVSPPIRQLLEPYNAAAETLRPIVAQIFNVPELAGVQRIAVVGG
jgi:NAD(P)-dependent dehydrogenase (short-subunit alcohol dehydrogenase family)